MIVIKVITNTDENLYWSGGMLQDGTPSLVQNLEDAWSYPQDHSLPNYTREILGALKKLNYVQSAQVVDTTKNDNQQELEAKILKALKDPNLVVFYKDHDCFRLVESFREKCIEKTGEVEPGFFMHGVNGYFASLPMDFNDFRIYKRLTLP